MIRQGKSTLRFISFGLLFFVFSLARGTAAITLTCNLPAGARVNVAYSGSCTASGGTTPYTYSISVGALPGGLNLNAASGAIAGTPNTAGTTSFTVKATDSAPTVGTATQAIANFNVAPAVLTLACNLPTNARVGVAYSGSCTATGGTTAYTYSVSAGALPGGLNLNPSTGAITGMPDTAGTTSFAVKVTDSGTPVQTATRAIANFPVAPAVLTLTCNLPAGAQVNVAYSGSCSGAGGTTPYSYSISAGALPAGLNLNTSTGAITGTPNTAGTTSFVVRVTDSGTPAQAATQAIANFKVAPAVLTLTCNLPAGAQVNVAYSGSCSGAGGTTPYSYSISVGALPGGLNLNTSTGAITGTPNTAETTSFTVKVMDGGTPVQTATQAIGNFVVSPPTLTLACNLLAGAQVNVAYSGSCTGAGGTTPYLYSISVGALPGGLTLNPSTGAITGTPNTAGTVSFTVSVTDGGSPTQSASQAISNFVVAPATLTLTCNLPGSAQVGVPYTGTCTGGGGTTPFNYSVSVGALPGGLVINPSTGAVTGTPNTAGTTSFTVKVTDGGTPAQTATQAISNLTVAPALLTLSCNAPSQDIVGAAYTGNCNVGGGTVPYVYSVSAGNIPGGLSVNPSNGAITGTPNTAGTFTFTVKVADGGIQVATQQLTVTIIPVLNITTTTLGNGIVGIAYSASCNATGGTPPYTYSISAGGLPSGLSLNSGNCAITGAPSASGTFNFAVRVTDAGTLQQTGIQPLSITVGPALVITSGTPPNGSVGLAYVHTLTAQNGAAPYNWSLASGAVPDGLNLNAVTGLISGIPTTLGNYSFTVRVTDSGSPAQTKTQAYNVSVAAGLTITTTSLPSGVIGKAYPAATLNAQNGQTPYSWSISAGTLPGGLNLGASGAITGIPSAAGMFPFTVRVVDSTSPTAQAATELLNIAIAPILNLSALSLPGGPAQVVYSASCSASGGTPPYRFSVTTGTLPAGLVLNTSNCTINGTPSAAGTSQFTITVTDSGIPQQSQQSASQPFSINIGQALTISTASLGAATVGVPYSATLGAQFGTTPYTWALNAGSTLPDLLSLNESTGTISGTPTAAGTYSFSLTVMDSGNPKQSASQTFSLLINPASAPAVPSFSFRGLPATQTPGQPITGAKIAVDPLSSAAWPITVTLGFAANAAGVPAGYADPALQFAGGGTSYSVTVPAMAPSIPLPQIAPGTVAGQISLTLTVQAQTGAISSITVPPLAPIITPGTVQILNVTASGFDVELVANSSPRDLKTATFVFGAAAGAQITGTSSFSVDVTPLMTNWYAGATSQGYGSAFSLTVPFTFSGSSAAISSVTVTLTNSVGTSTPVTGTK